MRRGLTLLLWAELAALAASLSLLEIRSYDYWWQLRTGAWIAETGGVPQLDPFTYTVAGARWIDIHWLFQLGLHGLHTLGGHAAVVLAKLALVLAVLGLLAKTGGRPERPAVAVAVLTLALLVCFDRIMPRPELVSFALLAAQMALLERFERRGDASVYAIVALQVVWVNLHGLFALGVALCAIHLLAELLRPLLAKGEALRVKRLRRLAATTALAALASLASPNGLEGALYPLQQLDMIGAPETRAALGAMSAELAPPLGGPRPLPAAHAALFVALAALSALAMALDWRSLRGRDELAWLAFLYLALAAKRNVALFAIVAAPIAVRHLNALLDRRPLPRSAAIVARVLVAVGLAALIADVTSGSFFVRTRTLRSPGLGVMQAAYPVAAADWIESERPAGPIAHPMALGGYLLWRLFPDYRVMSDGRLEVFGAEKLARLRLASPDRFRALDAEYGFGAVVVPYALGTSQATLLWTLYVSPEWRMVAVDEGGALFVRAARGGVGVAEGLDLDAPDLFAPLRPGRDGERALRALARVGFFATLGRRERADRIWKEHAPFLPRYLRERADYATVGPQEAR